MLTPEQLTRIRQFDTCTISDAIEQFGVRLRNEGFTRPGLRSLTMPEARVIGYAATFRVRSSDPPITGGKFLDRTDWWADIDRLPLPRIAVIRDLEPHPTGSCAGEIHSSLLRALGCQGLITNGAVRDLLAVTQLGFPLFAPHIAVSHAYTHVIDYGKPVDILGMEVRNGDLIYADCHGAINIPREVAGEVAAAASQIRLREGKIVAACLQPGLTHQQLRDAIRGESQ